jgi:hypothetical protein
MSDAKKSDTKKKAPKEAKPRKETRKRVEVPADNLRLCDLSRSWSFRFRQFARS